MRATASLGGAACKTAILVIITQEFQENVVLFLGMLEVAVGGGLSLGPVMGGFLYAARSLISSSNILTFCLALCQDYQISIQASQLSTQAFRLL